MYAHRHFGFLLDNIENLIEDKDVKWYLYLGFKGKNIHLAVPFLIRCLLENKDSQLKSYLDIYAQKPTLLKNQKARICRHLSVIFRLGSVSWQLDLYLIQLLDSRKCSWVLALPNAQDVVFALCQFKLFKTDNTVNFLLKSEIPFYTLQHVPSHLPPWQSVSLQLQLPEATGDTIHSLRSFLEYKLEWEELLDSPLGRAAGSRGGVIARL